MKKSFISLVAAAAIAGGALTVATTSNAGTVSTKGGTNVTMYGFIRTYFGWNKKTKFLHNTAFETGGGSYKDKTKWSGFTASKTRLGFKFNSGNGVSGKLETDFSPGTLRIRHAYVKQTLGGGAWVLVGQTWNMGIESATFTINWFGQPGFFQRPRRNGQIRIGNTFEFSGGSLTLEANLEDYNNILSFGQPTNPIQRTAMPGFGLKAKAKFNTGFGSPATVYGFALGQNFKVKNLNDPQGKSETPYVLGAGFTLPVSMVTLKLNIIYTKGGLGFFGTTPGTVPYDYYIDSNGSIKKASATAWNVEAKIKPAPGVGLYAGYDQVKFKNRDASFTANVIGNKVIRENQGTHAGITYKTSKVTTAAFEWDHIKTKYATSLTTTASNKGDQALFMYQYNF